MDGGTETEGDDDGRNDGVFVGALDIVGESDGAVVG
jgi:hypothetical protein